MMAIMGAPSMAGPVGDLFKSTNESTAILDGEKHNGAIHIQGASFVTLIRTCAKNKDLYRGTTIHEEILKLGLLEQCSGALVTMYAKCGELSKAKALLNVHKTMDAIPWTALMAGYTRQGRGQDALDCYQIMRQEGISPDMVTYTCILKACTSIGAIHQGEQVHDEIAKQGLLQNDVILGTTLVDMYAKCGALAKAQCVLQELPSRNVISWSSLIAGYVHRGQGKEALECFERMKQEGILPDVVTYASSFKACGVLGAIDKGIGIHGEVARQGLLDEHHVLGNCLVDMYVKCGGLSKAHCVLEELPSRDVVSWSTLIVGYSQQGQGEEALNCFDRMQQEGINPNGVTYASVLKACGYIGAADRGKQVYDEIIRQGLLQTDMPLGNALVDMYAKCGALLEAQSVLEELPSRNVVTWSTLIAGYAQGGEKEEALECFARMQHEGIPPNVVTFGCVLNVCTHLGLIEEGQAVFLAMCTKYSVKPNLDCYVCVIDLLGRAGCLEEAVRFVQDIQCTEHPITWHALLGSCQKRGDVNFGSWAFEKAVQLNRSDRAAYVLMANIYAAAGLQENAKALLKHGSRQYVV